jgi:hypothetical protein
MCGFNAYSLGFETMTLDAINEGFQSLSERMQVLNQSTTLKIIKPLWQATQNLIGRAGNNPAMLSGHILRSGELDDLLYTNPSFSRFSHYPQALVLYLFGDHQGAYTVLASYRRSRSKLNFNPSVDAMCIMLEGLCSISISRGTNKRLDSARYLARKLRQLASNEPKGNLAKLVLLEAEIVGFSKARTRRRRALVLAKYFIAVSVAKESGSILLYALANELTARYMLSRGKSVLKAEKYVRESVATYNHWGACAKAHQLQDEMPEYMFN